MTLNITEENGIQTVEFTDVNRFTLAIIEDVKNQLRPLLLQKGCKMLFDLHNINFIDSSGIGCIISLFKTANISGSTLKLCNLTPDVLDIFKLLHLQVIFDITGTRESCMNEFSK